MQRAPDAMSVRVNDVGAISTKVYGYARDLAKALEDGADVGLWVFGGRLATVMVVVEEEEEEESVSVASSFERGGSKMGVTGSSVGGNVGGIRRVAVHEGECGRGHGGWCGWASYCSRERVLRRLELELRTCFLSFCGCRRFILCFDNGSGGVRGILL
ncbi:hypothetical protein BJV77DRAFT_731581 [Russula vinacea]|nr:hypothetical protein BJV77DRAFT_731581 [Russula vinacea]